MIDIARFLPGRRRADLGRQAHFRRTAILAGGMLVLWLASAVGFAVQLRMGGAADVAAVAFWLVAPLIALAVFDRLQARADRACGGGERL